MPSRLVWYQNIVNRIAVSVPEQAHRMAAQQAAGLAARAIRSKATGRLARDVSRAMPIGRGRSLIGSSLPYAGAEQRGATIRPRRAPRLLIRGNRGGSRSTVGGSITASATEVQHKAKRYLDSALIAYPRLFVAYLRRSMPK